MDRLAQLLQRASNADASALAVVVGSGQIARYAVESGADLLVALNAGTYRHLGAGSLASFLPFANANDQTEELLVRQILPQARHTPIIAGVLAADPTQPLEHRLQRLHDLRIAGVVNWPAVGFVDGELRQALEADGLGIDRELEMLGQAKSMGLATFGFALTEDDAQRYAAMGVDGMILNLGLTREFDDVRERRDQIQQAAARLNLMLTATREAAPRCFCLAFGGPITTPEDLEELLRHSRVDGFAGGSVFERLPVQAAVTSTVRQFKRAIVARNSSAGATGLDEMLGRSAAMQNVFDLIKQAAPYDVNVCIEGETGTGKELVAGLLHRLSRRANQPFVTLNCGAIPESLLESELFGHEKGAFTGADRRQLGKFELADRGTLFLDEIADLSPRGQVAILRALQQREIVRVGGESPRPIDVRVLAASNQPLAAAVSSGRFRADLYYRLNYVTIQVPPLRERLDDLSLLVDEFLARLRVQLNRNLSGVTAAFLRKLREHSWPGNVRELEHVLGQAALREPGPQLDGQYFQPVDLRPGSASHAAAAPVPAPTVRNWRQELAQRTLAECRGNKSQAAQLLGITRRSLYAWLEEIG